MITLGGALIRYKLVFMRGDFLLACSKMVMQQTLPKNSRFSAALHSVVVMFLLFLTPHALASVTSNELELTDEERAWLETRPTVTFTGDPNWLPYEAFDSNGQYIGIVSEHLKLISKSSGITFMMSPSKTWTESTEKAKQGVVDILSETDDSDLKSHLTFTKPYIANPIVIAMHSRENYVESITDIKDRRIALIKDYGYAPKIRRKYSDINFVTVDDIQHGLVAVSTGEVDALLCTLALCSYTISELGLNNVRITGKTEFDTKLALGVQKNLPELVSILNKSIDKISRSQQQVILDKWIKQKFVAKTDYTLVYQILFVAILLITIFALWNRRLAREVELRTATEKELKSAEETLRISQQRLLLHREHTPLAVIEWNTNFEIIGWNKSAQRIFGFTQREVQGQHITKNILPDIEREAVDKVWDNLLKNRGGERSTNENITKDGRTILCEWYNTPLVNEDGEVIGVASLVDDVTERKKAEDSLRLYSMVLENSSEGMLVTDSDNKIIAINPAFTKITGYELEEVKGKEPSEFASGRHNVEFFEQMWEHLERTGHWQGEIWDKAKNGEEYAKWLTINTIRNDDGTVSRYVAVFSDITERKLSEEMIWKQANFDVLTGLPNRNMFHDRLEHEVIKSTRAGLSLALLLIDLDQFKEVNDTLGHDVGDMLLQEAARRIRACVRDSDTVARLGGDEFTVILSELEDKSHIEDVAQKIITQLIEAYSIGDELMHISGSIGITMYPDDTNDIDTLIKNADQAMYAAKKKGRNRFSYFTQSLQDAAQNRLKLKNDLRGALSSEQFEAHFQPIIDLSSGKIFKAEALIRWRHPQRGLVGPMDFIPLAEETGFINVIGDWVFRESARWAHLWSTQFDRNFQISVNMSPVQFKVEGQVFALEWLHYLQELGLSGENVVVEITEGLLLNAESSVIDKLLWLRDAGIQVAIDDFGTGYSALSYLKKFDIDYLKIDRIFVQNLETDKNDIALCEAIIVMAHKLGLKVIAEGVETEGQKILLAEAGCDYAQGYLYSKPVPAEEFELLLSAQQDKLTGNG